MKFLADENFPRPAVRALREAGFEVAWVCEEAPGASDEDVLARSASARLILLTLDKDFGELVFRRRLAAECGVILFRIDAESPEEFSAIAVNVLTSRTDWAGHFTVIGQGRMRMTPISRP